MTISKGARFKVLTRDNFTCRYCGRSAPEVVLHVDHVHPQSRGGSDAMDNLVTACRDCNVCKNAKILPDRTERLQPDLTVRTYPHPDTCPRCHWTLGRPLVAAYDERPTEGGRGFVGFYRCAQGHEWNTFWANKYRLTHLELLEALAPDDSIMVDR